MTHPTKTPRRAARNLSVALGVALMTCALGTGCTSEKEKAKNAITEAVEQCRKAKTDGPFYEVPLFDDKKDEILQVVCSNDIDKFEMTSEYSAIAFTGPVRWGVRVSEESGVWTLYSAEWKDLQRAKNALKEDDPSEESLQYAAAHFGTAQEQVPSSAWLKLRRLETLLELRMKHRKKDTPNPVSIGEPAQEQYDRVIEWAKKNDDLDTQVEAQYLVVDHMRDYLDRIDMVLSSDGSSDEWLIKAAEQAEKEGHADKAAEYRKELDEAQQKRAETQEIFTKRRTQAKDKLCEYVSKLSPAGVEDSDLQQRVVAAKEAIDCMKKAPAKVADED